MSNAASSGRWAIVPPPLADEAKPEGDEPRASEPLPSDQASADLEPAATTRSDQRPTESPASGEFSRIRWTSEQQEDEPTQPESDPPTDELASDDPFVDECESYFDNEEVDTIPAPPWLDESH